MRENQLFVTDNQNIILDCSFATGIQNPQTLQQQIRNIVGVVEHGLFLGMTHRVIVAGSEGLRTLS